MQEERTVVQPAVAEKIAAVTALATPGIIRLEPTVSALAASLGRRALSGWRLPAGALPPTAGVRADLAGEHVTVEVPVTIDRGRPVPEVAADAQRRIADALAELGGFTVDQVSILVVDVDSAARA